MHQLLEKICGNLEETARRIKATNAGMTSTFKEEYGNWTYPALNRDDLAGMALRIAGKIKAANLSDKSNEDLENLQDVPRRIELLWSDTVPNINGNFQAVMALIASFDALDKALEPIFGLQRLDDPRYLPDKTAGRLRAVNRTMDRIDQDHEKLIGRVEEINKAHAAAESLPTNLQDLEDARVTLEELKAKIEKLYEESAKTQGKIETASTSSQEKLAEINASASQANELVARCEEAYHITTTKGLAGAFDQRAEELKKSITVWVVLLFGALGVGGAFGSKRIEALSALTASGHPDWGIIVLHIVLSVLTVGGPLWFAWLSTKQIGQRFRLAEDYAFKASVAKAYEGYRKQAENLDESFASRLFSSALTRLDEAPLRLVEPDTHGSPWHEMLKSETINRAVALGPNFQEQVLDLARRTVDTAKSAVSARAKALDSVEAAVRKTPD